MCCGKVGRIYSKSSISSENYVFVFVWLPWTCRGNCKYFYNAIAALQIIVVLDMASVLEFVSDVWCPVEVNHGGSTR